MPVTHISWSKATVIQPSYPTFGVFLQTSENIGDDLLGGSLATQVRAQELTVLKVAINSSVDLGGSLLLVEELEHQSGGSESGNGVGNALALDVRGAAVARLTNGEALTDVGAGDETQAADEGSSAVGENVTVQVGGDDDVVVLGLAEELVDHGVDNLLLNSDGGVLGVRKGLLGGGAEETIGLRQNVGLVGDGDKGRLVDAGSTGIANLLATEGNVTSHGSDAERSLL